MDNALLKYCVQFVSNLFTSYLVKYNQFKSIRSPHNAICQNRAPYSTWLYRKGEHLKIKDMHCKRTGIISFRAKAECNNSVTIYRIIKRQKSRKVIYKVTLSQFKASSFGDYWRVITHQKTCQVYDGFWRWGHQFTFCSTSLPHWQEKWKITSFHHEFYTIRVRHFLQNWKLFFHFHHFLTSCNDCSKRNVRMHTTYYDMVMNIGGSKFVIGHLHSYVVRTCRAIFTTRKGSWQFWGSFEQNSNKIVQMLNKGLEN
jgi:hypothetical protein